MVRASVCVYLVSHSDHIGCRCLEIFFDHLLPLSPDQPSFDSTLNLGGEGREGGSEGGREERRQGGRGREVGGGR